MPDISMCADDACPVKKSCYRHVASGTRASSLWQTYSAFVHTSDAGCPEFWPVRQPAAPKRT